MEVDLPSGSNSLLSPRDRIVRRLAIFGVPKENLDQQQPGLVAFVKENKFMLPQLVDEIVLTNEDISEVLLAGKEEASGNSGHSTIKQQFHESLMWLQWLMFENEPGASLCNLAKMGVGQHGVCGAVWEQGDIAYHCCNCEHDPTCAICVPCFQNGDHRGHDYSLTYSRGGGCCDCGDVSAWKREGFCSKHRGPEQIEPLSETISNSVGPILDALLKNWKDKLSAAKFSVNDRESYADIVVKGVSELSLAVVDMMLNFFTHSEGLLALVSRRMLMSTGLLNILVRAERFLPETAVKKLHELLLKLLGEPTFKYEFAKVFVDYFPVVFTGAIRECSDSVYEMYPFLSVFSVQIFTVPTLTPRLVREVNLLDILLRCLVDLFLSCTGEEGYLQVDKWVNLYETTIHLLVDIRYVISHAEVVKYAVHDVPDLARTWIRILTLVQGMDPQKRVTSHDFHLPILLCNCIGHINSLIVEGAFSISETKEAKCPTSCHTGIRYLDDCDGLQHSKVRKLYEEGSVSSTKGRNLPYCCSQPNNVEIDNGSCFPIPSSVMQLIRHCLNAIDCWLEPNYSNMKSTLTKSLVNILKSRNANLSWPTPSYSATDVTEDWLKRLDPVSPVDHEFDMCADMMGEGSLEAGQIVNRMYLPDMELDKLCLLSSETWPEIAYDVSSQDISFNIPLHRLLSLLLQKALRKNYDESGELENASTIFPSSVWPDYFQKFLRGCHPHGFSAFMMEHPLRLRVFCAQVRAGMRDEAATLSFKYYRSIQCCGQGLEFDLFLLQCCAALAPPDMFVERILERFGLSYYTSLILRPPNEYEPILVKEVLSLIIQIIKERRFCGLSATENLRRELLYKLAVGDATHSELVTALPYDLSNNNCLKQTLDELGIYSNPSGLKQGKYSLRKSQWKELDLYHPRGNSRDLQIAEERYFEFCNVSALTVQLPHWTQIFYPLSSISALAISKAVLKIIRAVLFYAVFTDKSSVSRAPDAVLVTALHLLSLALEICCVHKQVSVHKHGGHSYDQPCMSNPSSMEESIPLLAYACEEINIGSSTEPERESMITLLVLLMRKYREENKYDPMQCNFSALIESLLKKLAELNAGCMTKLLRLAPEVVNYLSKDAHKDGMQTSATSSDVEERKVKVQQRQAAMLTLLASFWKKKPPLEATEELPEKILQFPHHMLSLLGSVPSSPVIDADYLREKMRAEQTKFIESLNSTANTEVDFPNTRQKEPGFDGNHVIKETAAVTCSLCKDPDSKSPLSYLIFLQKSRLTSIVERGSPSWDDICLPDKVDRSIIRNEASDSCSSDIISSSLESVSASPSRQLDQNRLNDLVGEGQLREHDASYDAGMDMGSSPEMIEDNIFQFIQREIIDILSHTNNRKSVISDGESLAINRDSESMILQEYIVALASEGSKVSPSGSGFSHNKNIPQRSAVQFGSFDGFGPIDCDGIHVSSCGHAIHQECQRHYLSSLRDRFVRGIDFGGENAADRDQGEFICPVCRRLANSILPAVPSDTSEAGKQILFLDDTLSSSAVSGLSSASYSDKEAFCLLLSLAILQSADGAVGKTTFLKALSSVSMENIRADIESVYHLLCKMYFPDRYDTLLASQRVSHSMIMWDTLTHSLIATEIAARSEEPQISTVASNSWMEDLCREIQSSNEFILQLLLQLAHTARGQNRLQVLLRFRGIQLLSGSICSGISLDQFSTGPGNILHALQDSEKGIKFPDTEFWKRAANPILVYDPFSSLMWALFCLPQPFLSSAGSFLSFVHLFYTVCVIQALVACLVSRQFDFSELRFGRSLINDVWKVMGESAGAHQYFVSRYIDASLPFEDKIRRFTIPYLRRCAYLRKLLKSSASIPFSDCSQGLDRLSTHVNKLDGPCTLTNNDAWGNAGLSRELKQVAELEHLFQISSLEKVLEDETVNGLALKWCKHFCAKYENYNNGHFLPTTPAIPFKLMRLPQLYEDLLQRYIKQRCIACKSVPVEPALCLLCGRLCSCSGNPCCRENECQSHAMACGAGIGIFLLIKKTRILLQRSAQQALWCSVYLDAFGEEDIDMHRGKPLYLNEERYATLTHVVASHSLDQMSQVLWRTTFDMDFTI